MMTKILATLSLALSVPAFAVWAPTWERPVEKAQMEVVKADGYFVKMQQASLTLNRRDGTEARATSLTLSYDALDANGEVAKVTHIVPVESISFNRCGGMEIKTRLKLYDLDRPSGYFPEIEIVLSGMANETGLYCLDKEIPHGEAWNANVRFVEKGSVNSVSTMDLKGFPEPLMTIQSLLE